MFQQLVWIFEPLVPSYSISTGFLEFLVFGVLVEVGCH